MELQILWWLNLKFLSIDIGYGLNHYTGHYRLTLVSQQVAAVGMLRLIERSSLCSVKVKFTLVSIT